MPNPDPRETSNANTQDQAHDPSTRTGERQRRRESIEP